MSKAVEASEPDHVLRQPETDTIHRRGDGPFEPACSARLHNADADYRLTGLEGVTDDQRCGHPECFGGDR